VLPRRPSGCFRESVRRLQAYADAGAEVLFGPGPHKPEEIKALVEAVQPKPFNLLVVRDIGLGVGDRLLSFS